MIPWFHMPPRPSNPDDTQSAKAEERERKFVEEISWGKPVFRPPKLPNPRVVVDPLPFPMQPFGNGRSAGGD
jgi:hypothetical protein